MAKQSEKESGRAVAKEACDVIDISRGLDKKNETKRVGIASAVDLRRPKMKWQRRSSGPRACYRHKLVLGASRKRKNTKTMTKQSEKERDRAVAKETCDAIDILRCFDKKNETKRVGIASAVDLRRPKT